MNFLKTMVRQLFSLVIALAVVVNLGFWIIPMCTVALIKFLFARFEPVTLACSAILEGIYRIVAYTNTILMLHVVNIDLTVDGDLPDHAAPIIVVNHQTWLDIPILHAAITRRGPILKFLIKRELVWVPLVGWICYALNFPRLNRSGHSDGRRADYSAIEAATSKLTRENGALLIFAEGTRFTEQKHRNQNSKYSRLLTPKPGGLKIALAAVPQDTPVLDVTINYNGGETNFWKCLHGANRNIEVHISNHSAAEIADARAWLEQRWLEKDARLAASR